MKRPQVEHQLTTMDNEETVRVHAKTTVVVLVRLEQFQAV
jgi:hypothetical protein